MELSSAPTQIQLLYGQTEPARCQIALIHSKFLVGDRDQELSQFLAGNQRWNLKLEFCSTAFLIQSNTCLFQSRTSSAAPVHNLLPVHHHHHCSSSWMAAPPLLGIMANLMPENTNHHPDACVVVCCRHGCDPSWRMSQIVCELLMVIKCNKQV